MRLADNNADLDKLHTKIQELGLWETEVVDNRGNGNKNYGANYGGTRGDDVAEDMGGTGSSFFNGL